MATHTVILSAWCMNHTWIHWRPKSHILCINLTIRVDVCLVRKPNIVQQYLIIISPFSKWHSLMFVLNCKFRQHTQDKSPCFGLYFCMLVSSIVIEITILIIDQTLNHFMHHSVCHFCLSDSSSFLNSFSDYKMFIRAGWLALGRDSVWSLIHGLFGLVTLPL